MKDPGPNLLEQQIETNTLLAAILAAAGGPTILTGGWNSALPILYPAIFMDQRDDGNPYECDGTGDDWEVTRNADKPFQGTKNLQMRTKLTTPATNDEVEAKIYLPAPENPWVLVQFLVALQDDSTHSCKILCEVTGDSWTNSFFGWVQIKPQTPSLDYWKSTNGGGVETHLGFGPYSDFHAWAHVQLAYNHKTGQWAVIKLNGVVYDIHDESMELKAGVSRVPMLTLKFRLITLGAARAAMHLHQILVTQHAEMPT